ncbi:glycosyltransferase 87 family protein [Streptomyces montanisoli]|uniref:glycosyltransferase 87 family protein n=1 Tax=Streptomyces montanisoli TaxID=2798581 RepID=UPI0027DE15E4|nr:glycosyltransferase 87 family protein [Streptomyces montanisoli]
MNDSARVAGPPRAGTTPKPAGRVFAARAALLATPARRASTAAVLIAATAAFVTLVPVFRHFFDAGVYYGTVDQWIHHGGHIYDYVRPGSHYGFTYPPFAALAMAPMALVSWPVVVALACALSVLASCLLLYWLLGDAVRRVAGRPWLAWTVIGCLFAVLEPVTDTFSFGQVNLVLVALVFADARLLATGRGRYAGIGTGLAAAVKLTPALFIGYLLVTGRRRQAAIATATAAAATLLAAAVDPGASRTYWTGALFDTGRVGRLAFVSNQSVQGVLARLGPGFAGHAAWLLCVAAVLAVWLRRSRVAAAAGDDRAGFALTGLAACLVSPVTWVHHLVWAVPALAVLADTGLRRGSRRTLVVCGALQVLLSSYVIWLWGAAGATGALAFAGGNTYVWITLGLLIALPLADPAPVAGTARAPGAHGPAEGSLSAGEASR